jgi:hypothetical protein
LQSHFHHSLVKFITKSELVVVYVKQFSQPLTNLYNIAEFGDVSNKFFYISEKKEITENDHYHFYFCHPLKSLLKKMFQISQTLI